MSDFRGPMRDAAVALLTDYKADADIKLQIYRARPRSLMPPVAFIDRIRETDVSIGVDLFQRTPVVDIVVLHGLFDSGEAVDQADAFVDGFFDWCRTRFHAAGANTLAAITAMEDEPGYVPDWQPENEQRSYYATVISLEGFAGG